MLAFNSEFQNGTSKISIIRLTMGLANGTQLAITEEDVILGSFSRDTRTSVDGAFTIGAAVTGKITVNIDNFDNAYSDYDFRDAIMSVVIGGVLSDNTTETVQVGMYTVDEYTFNGSQITLTAYDYLEKFDISCSGTTITFPITLENLIRQACTIAGVTLANASIPNGSYSITKQPPQWATMTWHDVISAAAQIACCFARMLPDGRLYFSWYDTSVMNESVLNGGTFTTVTTPYSDGDTADGGDFTYTASTSYDGGYFGGRVNVHNIGSQYSLTVDTDDVIITGISVVLTTSNNIATNDDTTDYTVTLGSAGYIVKVENNPLIETTANADAVCSYLNTYVTGMMFRPLNASVPENPAIEAGDMAIISDYRGNTYTCFISAAVYTTNAPTSITCDAESPKQNLKARYSESQKTQALAQRIYDRSSNTANAMMQTILAGYATTMGLYQYTQTDSEGGTIYVYGNKSTLASSNIRWKFSAGAMLVSSDYGVTWNGAITADGIAVLQEIYAVKVNADNILTGTLTIGGSSGNKNGSLIIKDASNNTLVSMSKSGASFKGSITSGSTITGATLTVGGSGTAGSITVKDASNNTLVSMDKTGVSIKGSITSGSTISGATISGNTISGGTISGTSISGGQVSGSVISGGSISIGDGDLKGEAFYVDEYGAINAYGMEIGYQGGMFLGYVNHVLYYGKTSVSDTTNTGYYIGTYNYSPYFYIGTAAENITIGNENRTTARISIEGTSYTSYLTVKSSYSGTNHRVYINGGTGYINASGAVAIGGNLSVSGTKSRVAETDGYGKRLLYAYETPEPLFGDVGEGVTDADGYSYIDIDPILAETIIDTQYQVFIQPYAEAQLYVVERNPMYFVVKGAANTPFGWELKARQKGYSSKRLEPQDAEDYEDGPEEGADDLTYVDDILNEYMEV